MTTTNSNNVLPEETRCPSCGGVYQKLGSHWAHPTSSCDYPTFTDRQWEIMTGLLMGDADIKQRPGDNPLLRLRMTNKRFLMYLKREFGPICTQVSLCRTAREQYESARDNCLERFKDSSEEQYNDLYRLCTRSNPNLGGLAQWYQTGAKAFPDDLELTPTIARMWYVTDGSIRRNLDSRPNAVFTATNENHRPNYLKRLFEQHGFSPHFGRKELVFPVDDTEELLEWMGSPPPGFEYKWGDDD